ncbi:MAG: S41 family peptidase [Caulobacter sp.]|nr:S41 family peptidase [Caulobacter sp.]
MIKSKPLAVALGALILAGSAVPGLARQTPVPPAAAAGFTTVSAAERAAAIEAIVTLVREQYVFPERRQTIIDRLEQGRTSGRYDLADPTAFAEKVSEDLTGASGDRHMYLFVDPAQFTASSAPDDGADAGMAALIAERADRDHQGLSEMKILGGNIRYLKIGQFHWVEDETGQAYQDAVRFLAGGDAIVIDLRGNGGGDAMAVQYLISHFMKGDVLLQTFLRGSETPAQTRTLAYLPQGRLTGKPLYVLMDRGSGSAAEEFVYHVQQFRLGELIGQTTAGAANNNDLLPIAPGFVLSLSTGRPVHAVSGTNWEAVGVRPDVETPPELALDVALQRALVRLAAAPTASDDRRFEYDWAKVAVEARLQPVTLPAARLKALAGRYGPATVTLRDGALWLARPERVERRLSPLDDKGLFAADGLANMRVRFTATGLELLRPDGSSPTRLPRG